MCNSEIVPLGSCWAVLFLVTVETLLAENKSEEKDMKND